MGSIPGVVPRAPWKVEANAHSHWIVDADEQIIASTWSTPNEPLAHILAAGPAMLAALQAIVHSDNEPLVLSDAHSRVLIDAARAAIAKATGAQP